MLFEVGSPGSCLAELWEVALRQCSKCPFSDGFETALLVALFAFLQLQSKNCPTCKTCVSGVGWYSVIPVSRELTTTEYRPIPKREICPMSRLKCCGWSTLGGYSATCAGRHWSVLMWDKFLQFFEIDLSYLSRNR